MNKDNRLIDLFKKAQTLSQEFLNAYEQTDKKEDLYNDRQALGCSLHDLESEYDTTELLKNLKTIIEYDAEQFEHRLPIHKALILADSTLCALGGFILDKLEENKSLYNRIAHAFYDLVTEMADTPNKKLLQLREDYATTIQIYRKELEEVQSLKEITKSAFLSMILYQASKCIFDKKLEAWPQEQLDAFWDRKFEEVKYSKPVQNLIACTRRLNER